MCYHQSPEMIYKTNTKPVCIHPTVLVVHFHSMKFVHQVELKLFHHLQDDETMRDFLVQDLFHCFIIALLILNWRLEIQKTIGKKKNSSFSQ